MKKWMGIDVGTSGVKAIVVDDDGGVIARGSANYAADGRSDAHEQDADDYLSTVRRVITECSITPDGVGVVGQTPSLVVTDEAGTSLRPVVTWRDTRAQQEAAELRDTLGSSIEMFGVDNLWDVSQLAAKLLWLSRNDPAALAATRWLLQPKDFIGLALTGIAATDAWSSKGLASVATKTPVNPVFEAAGATAELLPPMRDPWAALGETTADALGLPAGVTVAVGWSDALGGMLAIGAATKRLSFVLTGTSDIVGTSSLDSPTSIDGLYRVPNNCSPLAIDYGPTQSSGASLVWLSSITSRPVQELVELAASANDTAATFLPYLRGERAPLWNPLVRASLTGVAEEDGPAELALAIMRGVSLSNRHVLEASWRDGPVAELHVGGAHVDQAGWARARSDVLAQDLVMHQEPQLPALGAAILARTAATGDELATSYERLHGEIVRVCAPKDLTAGESRYGQYLRDVAAAVASLR